MEENIEMKIIKKFEKAYRCESLTQCAKAYLVIGYKYYHSLKTNELYLAFRAGYLASIRKRFEK